MISFLVATNVVLYCIDLHCVYHCTCSSQVVCNECLHLLRTIEIAIEKLKQRQYVRIKKEVGEGEVVLQNKEVEPWDSNDDNRLDDASGSNYPGDDTMDLSPSEWNKIVEDKTRKYEEEERQHQMLQRKLRGGKVFSVNCGQSSFGAGAKSRPSRSLASSSKSKLKSGVGKKRTAEMARYRYSSDDSRQLAIESKTPAEVRSKLKCGYDTYMSPTFSRNLTLTRTLSLSLSVIFIDIQFL